jgi:hypothetical protein
MGVGTILEFGMDYESELMFRRLTESGGRVSGMHGRGSVFGQRDTPEVKGYSRQS